MPLNFAVIAVIIKTIMKQQLPKKVLLLGSGGLKIGQAGEFDYSGSQALKALREEGIKTVLINPNIATIQTSEGMADSVYFLPVSPEFVTRVIEKEKPDGLLLAFGGQTALNCGVELDRCGILYKHGVKVLGTPVKSIEDTEDRALFVDRLGEIGAKTARSEACTTTEAALRAARRIGFPVMVRAAYALGGSGSGICKNEDEISARCNKAFASTPQVLVEEWLGGWKEIEYEVVRDAYDNCITVCNMENFDPLGIHTGESIVVAPSQTLTDSEYQKLRRIAIEVIRHLGIVGECNVQYALDPNSEDYRIIEVNARLSRSSALASKATGYPLAFAAAKISLGYRLTDIENLITKVTKACFEPALDYIVVKVPRWDLSKFKNVDLNLGSEMKSVGEVMSIGRTFEETLQKALRMTGIGAQGLEASDILCGAGIKNIKNALKMPTDRRIFIIYRAMAEGWSVDQIFKLTKIDRWFLYKIKNVLDIEEELRKATIQKSKIEYQQRSLILRAKQHGFSDKQIGHLLGDIPEDEMRRMRENLKIKPFVKQIDTLAAEYPAKTNYLYMTYNGSADDVGQAGRGVMVLGSGAYRIGSSVEFDWCCVNAALTARNAGRYSIMVNCNPETVSTDYDICDRLYFEELTLERILDIYEREIPEGIILSMGGQIPNNLAIPLFDAGALIYGTSPASIDMAEDRNKFSALLDDLGIEQPEWAELSDFETAKKFALKVGYPVLIRPSYVLSGAAMNVAWDNKSLEKFLNLAADVSAEHPVVISKFVENSKEIEIDAVAKHGELLFSAITEHIENAGVHSGDATVALPAQRLYIETIRKIRKISQTIAKELYITGPFNIQFLAQRNRVRVIECNLRASRSFPFCSKTSRVNMIDMAVRAMLDLPIEKTISSALDIEWVGVKAAQFSYSRLHGADPVSGVEMASTGEVGCIGDNLNDAFLKALLSVGYQIPQKNILLSTGSLQEKLSFLDSAQKLIEMGFCLFASHGTHKFLADKGIKAEDCAWPLEAKEHSEFGGIKISAAEPFTRNKVRAEGIFVLPESCTPGLIPPVTPQSLSRETKSVQKLNPTARIKPNIADLIQNRKIELIINIPKNNLDKELKNNSIIRKMAIDFDVPLITNIKVARQFVDALVYYKKNGLEIKSWGEYR
ncbi:MAG: carbamoyl-phosphate synthase (glutamine-hydrolyzing) large subunit [Termitinemataceae bacterium]|nr:MAG: carbamoyl-phosphate synthase (glutamine-hydrolyzing) large subunit [Termitinemataceae bacterium]